MNKKIKWVQMENSWSLQSQDGKYRIQNASRGNQGGAMYGLVIKHPVEKVFCRQLACGTLAECKRIAQENEDAEIAALTHQRHWKRDMAVKKRSV